MLLALEAQKHSEQWQRQVIPSMTKWLKEERWLQELPEPQGFGMSAKTAGNVASLQKFAGRRIGGQPPDGESGRAKG